MRMSPGFLGSAGSLSSRPGVSHWTGADCVAVVCAWLRRAWGPPGFLNDLRWSLVPPVPSMESQCSPHEAITL